MICEPEMIQYHNRSDEIKRLGRSITLYTWESNGTLAAWVVIVLSSLVVGLSSNWRAAAKVFVWGIWSVMALQVLGIILHKWITKTFKNIPESD